MPAMVDPSTTIPSLEQALREGIPNQPGTLHRALRVIALPTPDGNFRFTYVNIQGGTVKALAMFVTSERTDVTTYFDVGYASAEGFRGQGLATEIVRQGIEELTFNLAGHTQEIEFTAVVSVDNAASMAIMTKICPNPPKPITDAVSGQPALAFIWMVKLLHHA